MKKPFLEKREEHTWKNKDYSYRIILDGEDNVILFRKENKSGYENYLVFYLSEIPNLIKNLNKLQINTKEK